MKRTAGVLVFLAALGGCVTTEQGAPWNAGAAGTGGGTPASIPGAVGPWGQPVSMAAPYNAAPPGGEAAARAMMAHSMPMDLVQAGGVMPAEGPSGIMQAGGPGAPPPPAAPGLPPQGMLSPPGVPFTPTAPGTLPVPAGITAAVGAFTGPVPSRFPTKRTEVRFAGPATMKVSWYAPSADGKPGFSGNQLEVPGRYNFVQASLYRLKLSDIPNRPGLELYPTLEVVPSNARTDAFLAHSAVPIVFTEEDFDQVVAGNFLVKVIYLPDPQFQDLATTGPDEVVSTRLEPGVDPVAEAHRRGNILLIVRMGNIDLEAPNTPAMDAPSPYAPKPAAPQAMPGHAGGPGMPGMPGMPGPGAMGPYAGMPPGNMVMGPNGPVMVGPQGAMMPPYPQMMGNPAMQPGPAMLPPATGPVPASPTSNPQPAQPATPNPGGPVSKAPGDSSVKQAQYSTTTTTTPPADTTDNPPTKARPGRRWLFGN